MTFLDFFHAVLLGFVEGVTEFIPVSSTGHLIVTEALLGRQGTVAGVFDIFVQVGAILAVIWARRTRILTMARDFFLGGNDRALALKILIAFLPAAVVGALLHGFIKGVLFSPGVVGASLIVGGVAMLMIERRAGPAIMATIDDISYKKSWQIGLCQLFALIPGVSRAGASIVGAQALGVSRTAATEFSFFLAIPTLIGAAAFDLYKNWAALSPNDLPFFAVGTVAAFFSALMVVRTLIQFVGYYGFAPFAYYRMGFGTFVFILTLLNWI